MKDRKKIFKWVLIVLGVAYFVPLIIFHSRFLNVNFGEGK
jgi:hypothetical protein